MGTGVNVIKRSFFIVDVWEIFRQVYYLRVRQEPTQVDYFVLIHYNRYSPGLARKY
jgi:hypothetical protein